MAELDELRSADILDMDQVGRLLVELAADEEYLGPLIAQMPSESSGGKWLVKPERGPRLVLFHRPEGVMAYTHSHHCWVAVAPVRGVETHDQQQRRNLRKKRQRRQRAAPVRAGKITETTEAA